MMKSRMIKRILTIVVAAGLLVAFQPAAPKAAAADPVIPHSIHFG